MNSKAVALVSITFLVLLGAFVVPQLIQSTKDPQITTTVIDTGGSEGITEGLSITLQDSSNSEATVNVSDTQTGNETTLVIPEGGSANYSLPGGDGYINAVSTTNQGAELQVAFDPLYGYSQAGRTLIDNIGLILVLVIFIGVTGLISKELPS
jgi:cytoskeletal protein RodZ